MKKYLRTFVIGIFITALCAFCAEAATFSEFWYQDSTGWHVKDGSGNIVKNCWLCDNAVAGNGNDVWYLIDASGTMYSAGLVQDGTGNYYSLEMNHNGYYGMLRYESKSYTSDGLTVSLQLESSHNGSFAAIKNQAAIDALKAKYGLTSIKIDNSNIVFTAEFKKSTSAAVSSVLTDSDFTASGSSVSSSDVLSSVKSRYTHDAATYFYYDASQDASKEGVVKTYRGVTLGTSKSDVQAKYGSPAESGTVSDASAQKIIEIAYSAGPSDVKEKCKTYSTYYNSAKTAAICFAFDGAGCVSYIFYYLV